MLFAAASAGAALVAAVAVARHDGGAGDTPGVLRSVLVARAELAAGQSIESGDVEVRRFPASFVPVPVLGNPSEAVGERPAVTIPAGAYLLPTQLGPRKRSGEGGVRRFPGGGTPVEIGVAGAGALKHSGVGGGTVDVLVTRDSPRGLGGRTVVAVRAAILLTLEAAGGDASEWTATLSVPRADALRLVEADSYAREIRLIATGSPAAT